MKGFIIWGFWGLRASDLFLVMMCLWCPSRRSCCWYYRNCLQGNNTMLIKMLLQKSDNPPKWMPEILRYRDIPWILRYYDIPDIPWIFWCINYFSWWVERFILLMFRSGRLHQKPESSKWKLVHGSFGVSKKNTSNPPCCIWKPSLPIHILRQRFVVKFGERLDLRKKTSASCTKAPCVWRKESIRDIWMDPVVIFFCVPIHYPPWN